VCVCVCVSVPCVAGPAPGQSAETAAVAGGAGLSALLPPSWQMISPGEASKQTHTQSNRWLTKKYFTCIYCRFNIKKSVTAGCTKAKLHV